MKTNNEDENSVIETEVFDIDESEETDTEIDMEENVDETEEYETEESEEYVEEESENDIFGIDESDETETVVLKKPKQQKQEKDEKDDGDQQVETTLFKCPSCGNNFEFDPKKQKLVCPYCQTEQEIEDVQIANENSFNDEIIAEGAINNDVEIYRCSNCGSLSEKQKDGIAFECPYCKKTNVVLEKDIKGIKPSGVIPFKIDLANVSEIANGWIKKKLYAPRKIKKTRFDTFFKGIYSPCWTFDTDTFSVYEGRVGTYYTVTVGSGKNRHTERKIRWKNINGNVSQFFDDIKVQAGSEDSANNLERVAQYDTNKAVKYENSFLAGFTAAHYVKGIGQAWNDAKEEISEALKENIRLRYNADVVDHINLKTAYSNSKYKYILLPFWLGTYRYSQKPYSIFVNGANGEIWGQYPKSPLKITLTVILALAALGVIAYLLWNGNILQ
ncbi:MAG: hypothetical protein RR327_04050 [Clostridia bacterium]